jgi:hypothetical protein
MTPSGPPNPLMGALPCKRLGREMVGPSRIPVASSSLFRPVPDAHTECDHPPIVDFAGMPEHQGRRIEANAWGATRRAAVDGRPQRGARQQEASDCEKREARAGASCSLAISATGSMLLLEPNVLNRKNLHLHAC